VVERAPCDSPTPFNSPVRPRRHVLIEMLAYLIHRVNCTQHFLAVRVLRIWNLIPEDVVLADHLSLFIRRLERVKLNQFLIGKI